jgi:hypothetical protein
MIHNDSTVEDAALMRFSELGYDVRRRAANRCRRSPLRHAPQSLTRRHAIADLN